jgi:hypothetical protein
LSRRSSAGTHKRRALAAALSPLLATAGLTVLAGSAEADVTIGGNITAFPSRDMVGATGYELGEELTVEVLRGGVVIGQTSGPAVDTDDGPGLEVNHGPAAAPLPGDCWVGVTPDIVGGDVIRVTTPRGVDTMTVADVEFAGPPYLGEDNPATGAINEGNDVKVDLTGTAAGTSEVEFRRDKPAPRFRRGPFLPALVNGVWTATFRPSTTTSAEGLTTAQQRDIALNEAAWRAVVDNVTDTTIAESDGENGPAPGCPAPAEANAVAAGFQDPINIASGALTLSGTARQAVASVSITVGSLAAREATLSTNTTGIKTWELTIPKTDLLDLPDGNIRISSSFDGLAGTPRTILKDMVAPGQPTATPPEGTYATTQHITLNKPAGDAASKIYWEIGPATGPEPTTSSNLFVSQITVSATQTIKAIAVDPAGNPSTVARFDYTIGQPPPQQQLPGAPTIGQASAGDQQATVRWTAPANSGTPAFNSYEVEVRTGASVDLVTVLDETRTSVVVTGLTNDLPYTFRIRAVSTFGDGPFSGASNTVTPTAPVTITRPGAPGIGTAVAGNTQATVNWTAPTNTGGADILEYRVQVRTGTTIVRTVSAIAPSATSTVVTGLTNGTAYNFRVRARNSAGVGTLSQPSNAVTPSAGGVLTVPSRPAAPTASSGTAGGDLTAITTWAPPASNGGTDITGYVVRALRMSSTGTVLTTTVFRNLPASPQRLEETLPAGNYRFTVQARNSVGVSKVSPRSNLVAAR